MLLLPISFLISLGATSQGIIDTTFIISGYTCQCKYNHDHSSDSKILSRTIVPASYPGGAEEWKKFLKKNLGSKFKGWHEVQFRFDVDKNGDHSNFILLNEVPKEKFDEVIRVVQLSGKWFPAVQGGHCIKSIVRMMIEL